MFDFFEDLFKSRGGLGLLSTILSVDAFNRLSDVGERAYSGAQDIANQIREDSQFRPFTVTTATGSGFNTMMTPQGLQTTMELSPEEQALQSNLFGGASQFFDSAQQDTMDRERDIFRQIRDVQRPDERRDRLELEERLLSQGRLGTSSATFGGATPEQLALATAQEEARARARLSAMEQARQEQLQQSRLGTEFLSSAFLPQAQLTAALRPSFLERDLAQRGQQFGTGLFSETQMSGLDALLLGEQARANLTGGIGAALLRGLSSIPFPEPETTETT